MPVLKPGIIARLSHLIVIQVIFIFGALALVLFIPDSNPKSSRRLAGLGRELAKTSRLVAGLLEKEDLSGGKLDEQKREQVRHILDSLGTTEHVALVSIADSLQISFLFVYEPSPDAKNPEVRDCAMSSFLDFEMLHDLAKAESPLPQPLMDRQHLVYYQAVSCRSKPWRPVLVTAADHGLAVSARSSLQYAVFVLFLCSTLVSLLTVSLLLRKFKRPLDRIIAGLEETAEGKLHPLGDLETDPELGRLARAYNVMSRRLWSHRHQLDHYFAQMQAANAELKESQSFLRTLIDSSPLGVIVTDPEGHIIMFNRAAAEEFGCSIEEITGQTFHDLLAEKLDRPAASVDPEGREGFEVVCRRKNGDLFPAYIVASEVRADDGSYLANLYVCRNITETRDFQEMMLRLDRFYTRGEMAGDIAHEINNYLAVLMGNVELFPRLLKKGNPEQITKKLNVMHSALQNISCLSDGLLDSPTDALRLEPASISQLIERVIAFLKPQNTFDTVDVVTEVSGDLPVVYVDTSQVQQLLVNLIYNAAQALNEKDGEKLITVSARPADTSHPKSVKIAVSDNGPGVVPDKQHLVFKTRFTTKPRGHGIGLITCQKIVDNHGGSISYEYREGAVFSVLLPVGTRPPQDAEPWGPGGAAKHQDVLRP